MLQLSAHPSCSPANPTYLPFVTLNPTMSPSSSQETGSHHHPGSSDSPMALALKPGTENRQAEPEESRGLCAARRAWERRTIFFPGSSGINLPPSEWGLLRAHQLRVALSYGKGLIAVPIRVQWPIIAGGSIQAAASPITSFQCGTHRVLQLWL